MPRAISLPDQRGGLEPIHLRHLHVQQNHGEIVAQQALQRFAPRLGPDQVLAEILQHGLEGNQIGGLVVYQEDVDFVNILLVRGSWAAGQRGSFAFGTPRDLDRILGSHCPSAQPPRRPAYRYSHTLSSDSSWSISTGLAM
jgi:hypothetical protein